jgi:methylated-DNA-[protein]-cysteine S-methyltransferase
MSSSAIFKTAIGPCRISWSDRGLTEILLLPSKQGGPPAADAPPWVRDAIALFSRHLEGSPQDFSAIPLDTEGLPPFHRKVYEAARTVTSGRTVSYGELAAMAGSPGAARAVGQALAKNPFIVVVPCHRVLASNGAGGFSAPGGTATKARLLAIEGVTLMI